MRTSRALLAPLCVSLVVLTAPEAPAAENRAVAETMTAYHPSGGTARVAVLCTGKGVNGQVPTAVVTYVTCEIFDSSGDPANQYRSPRHAWSGPACFCLAQAHSLVPPVKTCTTVEADFGDGQPFKTARHCITHDGAYGAEPQTETYPPAVLTCLDPLQLEPTVMEKAQPVLDQLPI